MDSDLVKAARTREATGGSGVFCGSCGLEFTEGYCPDPCIGGYLPGVSHACCGHGGCESRCGGEARPYVVIGGVPDQQAGSISGKIHLSGQDALDYIEAHRHEATPDPA